MGRARYLSLVNGTSPNTGVGTGTGSSRILELGREMTDPARTEIQYSPLFRQLLGVVSPQERNRIVVDMSNQSCRGVELGIGRWV